MTYSCTSIYLYICKMYICILSVRHLRRLRHHLLFCTKAASDCKFGLFTQNKELKALSKESSFTAATDAPLFFTQYPPKVGRFFCYGTSVSVLCWYRTLSPCCQLLQYCHLHLQSPSHSWSTSLMFV